MAGVDLPLDAVLTGRRITGYEAPEATAVGRGVSFGRAGDRSPGRSRPVDFVVGDILIVDEDVQGRLVKLPETRVRVEQEEVRPRDVIEIVDLHGARLGRAGHGLGVGLPLLFGQDAGDIERPKPRLGVDAEKSLGLAAVGNVLRAGEAEARVPEVDALEDLVFVALVVDLDPVGQRGGSLARLIDIDAHLVADRSGELEVQLLLHVELGELRLFPDDLGPDLFRPPPAGAGEADPLAPAHRKVRLPLSEDRLQSGRQLYRQVDLDQPAARGGGEIRLEPSRSFQDGLLAVGLPGEPAQVVLLTQPYPRPHGRLAQLRPQFHGAGVELSRNLRGEQLLWLRPGEARHEKAERYGIFAGLDLGLEQPLPPDRLPRPPRRGEVVESGIVGRIRAGREGPKPGRRR